MDKQKVLDLIEKIPFFMSTHTQDKQLIADKAYFNSYKSGDLIIEQGTLNMSLFFLIKGKVSIYIDDEFVISFQGGGQPFGEMSFVNNDLSSATLKAETDALFLLLDIDKINSLNEPIHFRLRMNIYRACAEVLAKKLKSTNAIAQSYMGRFDLPSE